MVWFVTEIYLLIVAAHRSRDGRIIEEKIDAFRQNEDSAELTPPQDEGMFPGYLFGRFGFAEHHRHILSISGVATIVRFGERPAIVPDEIIAKLRSHVTNKEPGIIAQLIEPSAEVKIVAGAFTRVKAVSRVLPARERIAVLLAVLGMEREVEISTGAAHASASACRSVPTTKFTFARSTA